MDLLEKVKAAGVIGAGGAGFPTYVKLGSKAEYLLMNGAECEPLLRVDQQLMAVYSDEILKGFQLAKNQVEAKTAIIGVKSKHGALIELLNDRIAALGLMDEMSVHPLPDVYPAGDEQVLVYELTGRVVPEMGIPIAVGCVVINSETALNIYKAAQDEAVTLKYVTVAGEVPAPLTVSVPVGTPIRELLKMAGVVNTEGIEIIDGGPMMGPLLDDIDGFVSKKTKGLVALPAEHSLIKKKQQTMKSAEIINKSACEQCRMCTDLCPRYLLGHSTAPHKMVRAMAYNVEADELMTAAQTCCQCNLCEYFSCPAGISPKKANVFYMNKLREKGIKHKPEGEFKPREMREYRMIPSKRLIARLELTSYDRAAELKLTEDYMPETVGIYLAPHVGAKAVPSVKEGDIVKKGDIIGDVPEGSLGVPVHASIDGTVTEINDKLILIRRN